MDDGWLPFTPFGDPGLFDWLFDVIEGKRPWQKRRRELKVIARRREARIKRRLAKKARRRERRGR